MEAALISACAELPTFRPEMVSPCPELSRKLKSESITAMKRAGDSTDPCFTLRWTKKLSESRSLTLTTLDVLEYQSLIRRQDFPFTPNLKMWKRSVEYSTESKAFSRSKKQRYGVSPSQMCFRMISWVEKIASMHERPF